MIALTQEKREEIIFKLNNSVQRTEESRKYLIDNVCNGLSIEDSKEVISNFDFLSLIYKIALESLTAKPVAYWNKSCALDEGAFSYANDGGCESPLYTAPPVPEIKFPDKDKLPGWARSHEDALDWYEAEIKSINGLGGG